MIAYLTIHFMIIAMKSAMHLRKRRRKPMGTISEMRLYLMSRYPNSLTWHRKVQNMPTRQVVAIYKNMTVVKPVAEIETEGYHQIDMFEYMTSLTQNNTEVSV